MEKIKQLARASKNIFVYTTIALLFSTAIASIFWLLNMFDMKSDIASNGLAWVSVFIPIFCVFSILSIPADIISSQKTYRTLKAAGIDYFEFIKKDSMTRRKIFENVRNNGSSD